MKRSTVPYSLYLDPELTESVRAGAEKWGVSQQDYARACMRLADGILHKVNMDELPKGRVDAAIELLGTTQALMITRLVKPVLERTHLDTLGEGVTDIVAELMTASA